MTDTLDAKQWALDHSPDALKGRKIAVAYGGGSNSTALLLRFHELGILMILNIRSMPEPSSTSSSDST